MNNNEKVESQIEVLSQMPGAADVITALKESLKILPEDLTSMKDLLGPMTTGYTQLFSLGVAARDFEAVLQTAALLANVVFHRTLSNQIKLTREDKK